MLDLLRLIVQVISLFGTLARSYSNIRWREVKKQEQRLEVTAILKEGKPEIEVKFKLEVKTQSKGYKKETRIEGGEKD